jgi:hypothetical protein
LISIYGALWAILFLNIKDFILVKKTEIHRKTYQKKFHCIRNNEISDQKNLHKTAVKNKKQPISTVIYSPATTTKKPITFVKRKPAKNYGCNNDKKINIVNSMRKHREK